MRRAPEGWRTPGRWRESGSASLSARFWSAAALCRFGNDGLCKELEIAQIEVLDVPMECAEKPGSFEDAGWKRGLFNMVVAAAVFAGVFGLTLLIYFPHSSWGRQERNLRLASKHLPVLKERLQHLQGVDRVNVGRYTGLGGSISVDGNVPDQRTAEAVVRAIVDTSPPVPVSFNLTFNQTNILRKIVQPTSSSKA